MIVVLLLAGSLCLFAIVIVQYFIITELKNDLNEAFDNLAEAYREAGFMRVDEGLEDTCDCHEKHENL